MEAEGGQEAMDLESCVAQGILPELSCVPELQGVVLPPVVNEGIKKKKSKASSRKRAKEEKELRRLEEQRIIEQMRNKWLERKVAKMMRKRQFGKKKARKISVASDKPKKPPTEKQVKQRNFFRTRVQVSRQLYANQPDKTQEMWRKSMRDAKEIAQRMLEPDVKVPISVS